MINETAAKFWGDCMMGRVLIYLVLGLILVAVFNNFGPRQTAPQQTLNNSDLLTDVRQGKIRSISISGGSVFGVLANNTTFVSHIKQEEYKPLLIELSNQDVARIRIGSAQPTSKDNIMNLLPWIVLMLIWMFVIRTMARNRRQGQ